MDRYIGLDAHASSCTVAVIGPSGRRLQSQVLETNAKVLIGFLKTIPGTLHLCLEEGTHSHWLYEMLKPHVSELVVIGVGRSTGSKSDERDAFGLAEALRVGSIKTRVYKGLGEWEQLRELTRAHAMVVSDSVRVQNRIKSLYRSRGISTAGKDVYRSSSRAGSRHSGGDPLSVTAVKDRCGHGLMIVLSVWCDIREPHTPAPRPSWHGRGPALSAR